MRYLAVMIATLALAPAAAAADGRTLPWAGGNAVVSEFEAHTSALSSSFSARTVSVFCNGDTEWGILAREGDFDANVVWGYVVFQSTAGGPFLPLDYTHLSPNACWYLDRFWAAPDKLAVTKRCRTGTNVAYRTVTVIRALRVRVGGRWTVRRVRRKVQRPVETPVFGECPDYLRTLFALQTLAHESVHLRGFADEGLAECYGLQLLDDTARWLGAGEALAAELAADYFDMIYLRQRVDSEYFRADCVDGSALDLSPESAAWPAGGAGAALPTP